MFGNKAHANCHLVINPALEAAERIRQIHFREPVLVDGDLVIVVGHSRFKAAAKLSLNVTHGS